MANEPVVVLLENHEMRQCADVAVRRQLQMWHRNARPLHGEGARGDHWQRQIIGAMGELALAKWAGRYWDTHAPANLKNLPNDVGPWEVRSTEWANGRLIVHDYDRPVPFVLAIVHRNRVKLAGWVHRDEAEWRGDFDPSDTHPTWKVPQRLLWPMTALPTD